MDLVEGRFLASSSPFAQVVALLFKELVTIRTMAPRPVVGVRVWLGPSRCVITAPARLLYTNA